MNRGPAEIIIKDGVKLCASNGRMVYDPKYHESHKVDWNTKDLEYLCAMYERTKPKANLAIGMGRTVSAIYTKVSELKADGAYESYKARGERRLKLKK